ncbi:hypothetical protein [Alcaligenes sp. CHO6]|uniref:hypothetical protein n=1 Tax=Alcaligenes sp. CHO6 TaxID=3123298 RepID=UPI0030145FF5
MAAMLNIGGKPQHQVLADRNRNRNNTGSTTVPIGFEQARQSKDRRACFMTWVWVVQEAGVAVGM